MSDQSDSACGGPSVDEVLRYARQSVEYFIQKRACDLPPEQKEEIRQEAVLRVWRVHGDIDAGKGWKSFVQAHARCAVLDYLRDGEGFRESAWERKRPDVPESSDSDTSEESGEGLERDGEPQRLRVRLDLCGLQDGVPLSLEEVIAIHGVFHDPEDAPSIRPNWPLIARMAQVDEDIHIVGKILAGFKQAELAEDFNTSPKRISQRVLGFFDRLDSPEFIHSRWVQQAIYAFGLCGHFQMPEVDNGEGWEYEPVDLLNRGSARAARERIAPEFEF